MVKLNSPFSTTNHLLFFLGVIIIISDQLTKAFIRATITVSESITIIPSFFSIVHFTNTGAGFGILKNRSTILVIISIVTIIFLFFYFNKREKEKTINLTTSKKLSKQQNSYEQKKTNREQYALTLIIAGAFSNLIDRIIFGTVTDFIYFHFWPAFNIADSAITIGAIILVIIHIKK